MKTMTCKDLGGPCDQAHSGADADEVINAQDRHLKEMVAAGDDLHADARKEMKRRWLKPWAAMGWYKSVKQDFADLPEDPTVPESA